MKIGFELEAFCLNVKTGNPILVPTSLPMDECGWLVEVRSEPHTDIVKAIHLLRAETEKVQKLAGKNDVVLLFEPLYEIPRDLKVQAARRTGKGILQYRNVYGHETHKNSTRFATASMHISFTEERQFHYWNDSTKKNAVFTYQGFIDHAKLIFGLDAAFKEEIKQAKRNPGFYEVKYDGRIEYRSLPNNVSLGKVQSVLENLISGTPIVEDDEEYEGEGD